MSQTEKKRPVGRPTKYDPKYCQEIIDYFDREPEFDENNKMTWDSIPTLISFAMKIGVGKSNLYAWSQKHEEFRAAYKKAKELQEEFFMKCGMLAQTNTAMTIFALKNLHDWTDKVEQKNTVDISNLTFDDDEEE